MDKHLVNGTLIIVEDGSMGSGSLIRERMDKYLVNGMVINRLVDHGDGVWRMDGLAKGLMVFRK